MKKGLNISKLSRLQLIEIMLEQEKRIAELNDSNSKLTDELEFKKKIIDQNEFLIKNLVVTNKELQSRKTERFNFVEPTCLQDFEII